MKKLSVILAIFMMGVIGIALLFVALGFRINLTNSIPVGLYRIINKDNIKNSFVIFCPDNRPAFRLAMERGYISSGLCLDGYGYLMKKVIAIQNDIVSVTHEGVFVNQALIPFSQPKTSDDEDHKLPQWRVRDYQLKENEFLTLTSQSEWSFDGRYYGIVLKKQIKGAILSVWTKPLFGINE